MFSAELSSGHAGGKGTSERLFGSLSLGVVCQPALSRMMSAWAPGMTARPISSICFGVGKRHDERDAGIAAGTDRAEQIGVFIALIFRLAWPRALLRPLVDETILLPDAHFVLEPHLDRRCWRQLFQRFGDTDGEVFLNAAIA